MKILVSQIDPNPHRDLTRNPVNEEQVAKIIDSIKRTGFWDNVVIRPHPEIEGRYQLAYGHNRLEACRRTGILEVDLPVRNLSDYDMYCCMVDENHTQQQITPTTTFENIVAAVRMAENLLRSTDTVEQFNARLQRSVRPRGTNEKAWAPEEYTRAKNAIAPDGPGLGKDVVKHFMPTGSAPKNDTIQVILDSYYAERRERAARKRLEAAVQEEAQARAANDEVKAKAAHRKQREAQAKLDRASYAGIKRELLERLDSNAKMNDLARLIKRKEIPPEYHEELIGKAAGWAPDSTTTDLAGTSISVKGAIWWNTIVEKSETRIKQRKAEARFKAFMEAYGDIPLGKAGMSILGKIHKSVNAAEPHFSHLDQASEFFNTLPETELDKLLEPLTSIKAAHLDYATQLDAIIRQVNAIKQPREKEINPTAEPLLLMRY